MMNFNAWKVDLAKKVAVHESGFRIRFVGIPKDPSEIHPENWPQNLSYADQACMLREGMQAISHAGARSRPPVKNKPSGNRNILSLKKPRKPSSSDEGPASAG